jgi:GT2 family glycosyltransferase
LAGSATTVAYAYTKKRLFGDEDRIFDASPFLPKELPRHNFVHAAALMRREAFNRVGGYNTRFALGREDHELWVRMLDCGLTGVFVPKPLLRYRRHGKTRGQLSPIALEELSWRLRLTFPRLYWRELIRHPATAVRWLVRLRRELDRPHAQANLNPGGA